MNSYCDWILSCLSVILAHEAIICFLPWPKQASTSLLFMFCHPKNRIRAGQHSSLLRETMEFWYIPRFHLPPGHAFKLYDNGYCCREDPQLWLDPVPGVWYDPMYVFRNSLMLYSCSFLSFPLGCSFMEWREYFSVLWPYHFLSCHISSGFFLSFALLFNCTPMTYAEGKDMCTLSLLQ